MRAPIRFTLRHAAFLLALVGIALLLRSNTGLPVHFRFPGMLVLALFAAYLATRDTFFHAQKR
jgi:hypothetical protein